MTRRSTTHHDDEQAKQSSVETSTRERIIARARQHFFAYGFRRVTMDYLSGELGMSKKTLYAYFPSKAALMEAVLLDKFQDAEADLERITSMSSSDFPAAFGQLLECMQKHTGEIQPPFVRDVRREAPELFKLAESRRRDLIHRYFVRLLNEGRRAGIIRKDIPAKLVIEILLAAVDAIINPQRLAELGLSLKAGFSTIITVIFEGVITKRGSAQL